MLFRAKQVSNLALSEDVCMYVCMYVRRRLQGAYTLRILFGTDTRGICAWQEKSQQIIQNAGFPRLLCVKSFKMVCLLLQRMQKQYEKH